MIVAIGGQKILVSLVERFDLHTQGRVLLLDILDHHILDGIDEMSTFFFSQLVNAQRVEIGCDVLLLNHEAHEEVLIGQFFLVTVRYEAIQHVIVLHSRVRTNGLEAAVVVRKHESIGRNHDT